MKRLLWDLFLIQFPHIEKRKGKQFLCAKHHASYYRQSKVNEAKP